MPPVDFRPYFDAFSWKSFIALVWPADPAKRGVPIDPQDPSVLLKAGTQYPSVWSTYYTGEEMYGPSGPSPCPAAPSGMRTLLMATKSSTLLQDVNQAFSYPLVDQRWNYVYYEIDFNPVQYEFVRSNKLYLAKELMAAEMKAPVAMPISSASPYRDGALMVKAAWKQLTDVDDLSTYYTVPAQVLDTSQQPAVCRNATMGLIGFHIARKVADFPQWIWSTFEHVRNVPGNDGAPQTGPFTLNNGTGDPATVGGWADRPDTKQLLPQGSRTRAQVTRFNPIPTTPSGASTVDVNRSYRALLGATVWRNYQLVTTQWPAEPVKQADFKPKENQGVYPVDAGTPFPLQGVVNTSLETFFQSQNDTAGAGGNSCMQCHYGAGNADFSWSLVNRSH